MNSADQKWMDYALQLARRGEGLTRPNPPVGAVLIRQGRKVGEGWHRRAGGPHAEVYALRQAGEKARGATLYVTLEPCSTVGRTPPCTQSIIEHGVSRVVLAAIDPNPKHASAAVRILKRHGIEVVCAVDQTVAMDVLDPFRSRMLQQRPWVTLKLGVTMDGRIADRRGQSKWITGAAAREDVQALRRRCDAIWVGAGTVLADNPSLWPRPDKGRRPWRIVSDDRAETAPDAKVYVDKWAAHTLLAVTREAAPARLRQWQGRRNEIITVPKQRVAAVRKILRVLYERGALHVLCEGGGTLADALIRARVVDELVLYIAPRMMGGNQGVPAVQGSGRLMHQLSEWTWTDHVQIGTDLRLTARPVGGEGASRPHQK